MITLIGIAIILLIAAYGYYSFPRKVNLTYYGIKYKIGDSLQQEQVKISMNGFYYNRLFAKDYFEGSIRIDNESYPNDSSYPRLKLLVQEELQMISYYDFKAGRTFHTYGEIFMGKKLKELTICVQDEKGSWYGKDGLMVSAPAKNRTEAVNISNELMNSILRNKVKIE